MIKSINYYLNVIILSLIAGCNGSNQTLRDTQCDPQGSFLYLEQCAIGGDISSQYNLAVRYMDGLNAPKDLKQAFYWMEQAAKNGDIRAQSDLGLLYYNGWGIYKDYKKAFEWTQKAAEQGSVPANNNMGFFYSHGIGVSVDWKKGAEYYQLAADQGYIDAYQNLSTMYFSGKGVDKDINKALEFAKRAAEDGGNQMAIYNLGTIYSLIGKKEDAIFWLRKAAELNMAVGQAELAGVLAPIAKTEAEKQEAKLWLEKALAQNEPYAYTVAGVLYSEKNNVFPINEKKAYEYYKKAAELGEEKSQTILASWYWEGRYVPKDEITAVEWFERAANNGEIKAAKKLVEIYGQGSKNIPKNEVRKQYWQDKLSE